MKGHEDYECDVALYNHKSIEKKVHEAIVDGIEKTQWSISVKKGLVRLFLGITCMTSCGIHCYKYTAIPYPDNFMRLLFTVIVYFAADAILTVFDYLSRPMDISARRGSDTLRVSMHYPSRSTTVTLGLSLNKKRIEGITLDLTKIITKEGVMDQSIIHRAVRSAIASVEGEKKKKK